MYRLFFWKRCCSNYLGRTSKYNENGGRNEMCTISVIVPVYNVEKYLRECLDSIVNQSVTPFEVICIDDASTDSSFNILKDYAGKYDYITLVQNETNKGQSFTRNLGVELADGEYLFFVDSDDYLNKDAIRVLNDVVEKEALDVIAFSASTKYENNGERDWEAKGRKHKYPDVMEGPEAYLKLNENKEYSGTLWQHLFRRELILKYNIEFIGRTNHEDVVYTFLSYINAKKVKVIEHILYTYRLRDDSLMTGEGKVKRVNGEFVCYVEILKYALNLNKEQESQGRAVEHFLTFWKQYITKSYIKLSEKEKYTCIHAIDVYAERELFINLMGTTLYSEINYDKIDEIRNASKVYVYGAGVYGKRIIKMLEELGIPIDGVLVTCKEDSDLPIYSHRIMEFEQIKEQIKDSTVIVAVSDKYQSDIHSLLQAHGIKNRFSCKDLYFDC